MALPVSTLQTGPPFLSRDVVTPATYSVLLIRWARSLAEEWGPPRPVWELALEERLGRKLTLREIQPSIRRVR